MFSVVNYSNGQQQKPIQFLASYHGGVTFVTIVFFASRILFDMQALFTEGALVDVRAEERTGRRNSVGGRAWVKKVVPGTPTADSHCCWPRVAGQENPLDAS